MGGYRVKKPYPYVHEIRDRHGHLRAYLRKPGCPSVTLPLPIGSRAFVEAYQAALEVAPKIIGRTIRTGVSLLWCSFTTAPGDGRHSLHNLSAPTAISSIT